MKKYLISGLVDSYRIKVNLFAASPSSAISFSTDNISPGSTLYCFPPVLNTANISKPKIILKNYTHFFHNIDIVKDKVIILEDF